MSKKTGVLVLTRDLVLAHVREMGVGASLLLREQRGQGVAVGQSEVPPGLEEDAALLVVLDEGPLVVAEELLDGHAVLAAQGLQTGHPAFPLALREGVRAQDHLGRTPAQHMREG